MNFTVFIDLCIKKETDFRHGSLIKYEVGVVTLQDCIDLCRNNEACTAWVLVNQNCFLKNNVALTLTQVSASRHISGFRNCYRKYSIFNIFAVNNLVDITIVPISILIHSAINVMNKMLQLSRKLFT